MTGNERTDSPAGGGNTFDVGHFKNEDAAGIVKLFRSVYGEGYPIKLFYDEEALREANKEGRYLSIAARAENAEIVGVEHLFRSSPHEAVYEAGAGLVHKDFRKLGINTLMLTFLFEQAVPRFSHIEQVFGEAVCNHPVMQKTLMDFGFSDMAIEVALMPAEAYSKEKSATGRVATVLQFRTYRRASRKSFIPPLYEKELSTLYEGLDDSRELSCAEGKAPAGTSSHITSEYFDFSRVARIAVHEPGEDFPDSFSAVEKSMVEKGVLVLQAWLPLSSPSVGETARVLRERGYFFGGLLPRWFDGDGLLMQKLLCPPDFEQIVLYSDRARQILVMVKADFRK
ncbi:MAG: hypothetical protein RDV48_21195 [Candidatus Eremiobacteraeota bacterium]|nr:hypothetical protein [Candidatus Eremiobacteraeota bacterium]